MIYTLNITPQTSPRPRVTRFATYMPAKYVEYKKSLISAIKETGIPFGDYEELHITCFFPYPKATPKKNRIEGTKHKKKPDADNILKGIKDAITQALIIKDDNQISDCVIRKRYTVEPEGRIVFELI